MKGKFIKDQDHKHFNFRRIAFVHHKGGTGKTTACLNIAGWLSKLKQKVLVIDLDPQANATAGLGVNVQHVETAIYHVLLNKVAFKDIILETNSNVFLAPSSINLLKAETELILLPNALNLLAEKLAEISQHFNYILIDSPPGSTFLMMNAISATRNIIIPMDSGVFSFETLLTLKELILSVENKLQIDINIMAGLLKSFSTSLLDGAVTKDIYQLVQEFFIDNGLQNCPIQKVPFSRKVCLSQMQGLPISHYSPNSKVSRAYQKMAQHIVAMK